MQRQLELRWQSHEEKSGCKFDIGWVGCSRTHGGSTTPCGNGFATSASIPMFSVVWMSHVKKPELIFNSDVDVCFSTLTTLTEMDQLEKLTMIGLQIPLSL